jgi:HEPN domain-containing protein
MIREIIRPQTNQVIIHIPQDMVDKELELIVFAIKQDTGTGIQKIKSRQLMDKILKALYVQANFNQLPPKTHNLVKLARLSKLDLSMEQEILLDEINDFNLEVRYPQYKNEFYKKCTREFSADYYQKINEMMIWLKSQIE